MFTYRIYACISKRFITDKANVKEVVQKTYDNVVLLELNRPKQLNALNKNIIQQLIEELDDVERNDRIKVAILTGGGKAFAAGADISEMADFTFEECLRANFLQNWKKISGFRKPLIAAINGYAVIRKVIFDSSEED